MKKKPSKPSKIVNETICEGINKYFKNLMLFIFINKSPVIKKLNNDKIGISNESFKLIASSIDRKTHNEIKKIMNIYWRDNYINNEKYSEHAIAIAGAHKNIILESIAPTFVNRKKPKVMNW